MADGRDAFYGISENGYAIEDDDMGLGPVVVCPIPLGYMYGAFASHLSDVIVRYEMRGPFPERVNTTLYAHHHWSGAEDAIQCSTVDHVTDGDPTFFDVWVFGPALGPAVSDCGGELAPPDMWVMNVESNSWAADEMGNTTIIKGIEVWVDPDA